MPMLGRLRRLLAPLALFAGLFLFGVTLVVLGLEGSSEGKRELEPSTFTLVNGTGLLVYPVDYYPADHARVEVAYAFPRAPGEAYFLGCDDLEALLRGEDPASPGLAFTHLQNGTFVVSAQTVRDRDIFFRPSEVRTGGRVFCEPAVAFRWSAEGATPSDNLPTVRAVHHLAPFEGENIVPLLVLMVAAPLLSLTGGLAWARQRARHDPPPPPSEDSTVEALRRALDRMGEQLERTRRHLLFAGVLGIFLWYPILVPWSWQQAAAASEEAAIPFLVAALTLAFLVVLTLLWAREFNRLDRELNAWRGRMRQLREREDHLMDALDHDGR